MASDGGQVRQLTSDEGDQMIPSWSGDGNWIYYASKQTGRYEIWKVSAKSGKRLQVTRAGGFVASESQDGRFLFYMKFLEDQDYYSSSGLWELPLGGGDERLLLKSDRLSGICPARGRDVLHFVPLPQTVARPCGSMISPQARAGRLHPSKKKFAGGLTVSPDRKSILFSVFARTGSNVMVVENFK